MFDFLVPSSYSKGGCHDESTWKTKWRAKYSVEYQIVALHGKGFAKTVNKLTKVKNEGKGALRCYRSWIKSRISLCKEVVINNKKPQCIYQKGKLLRRLLFEWWLFKNRDRNGFRKNKKKLWVRIEARFYKRINSLAWINLTARWAPAKSLIANR